MIINDLSQKTSKIWQKSLHNVGNMLILHLEKCFETRAGFTRILCFFPEKKVFLREKGFFTDKLPNLSCLFIVSYENYFVSQNWLTFLDFAICDV